MNLAATVLMGARVSLMVGLIVVGVSATVGMIVGALSGYYGGWLDQLIGRVMDVLMAFPGLLLAIALVAVLGPSLTNVVLALATIGWVGYARLVRGQVLRAREFDYVHAARALGARTSRILVRHVLPSAVPIVLVQATLGMAGAMLSEAALSFLGLGVQPPTPSWGTMINGGRAHLLDAPHLTVFPGICLALVVLGFNFLGDGLRDAVDRRNR
jgi:peptide/nickel transport system permease protein